MANVKFLMGNLADLPNTKTEGQVYFTYKNVGSADNPNYVGALYLDKNNSVRIKMTANADIAEKDSAGNTITSTYIKNASISSNGTSNTLTFTKGDNKNFTVTIPAATDSLAGLITNGEQTFSGTKTFNNTINLVNDKTGINWSRVTDGASILFYAETDATDNYLDFHVTDDENVNFRWTKTVGSENLILGTWKREGIRLGSGKFIGDLTGNADSATKLKTARSINGTNFDGTGNITTTSWGTSRTITIGGTSKSVNGGSNVSWSLSEIGASAIGHTHTSIIDSGNNSYSITFSYSKAGLDYSAYTWLAAWNGTDLRAVNKSQFATAGHTHNYAGSASAGGSANSAVKLDTATSGSATQPVYFSGGKPVACTYTLGKSVPSNAVFTDTNTWRPLGTTADTACAGNDSRLSNARPASDVYGWAKASTKPSYSWGEITGKPSTFTPSSHEHNKIIRSTHLDTIDALNAFKEANAFKYATVSALSGLIGLAQNDGIILSMTWKDSTTYGHQIFIDDSGYTIAHRYNGGNTWSSWSTILDSSNYTSYTVSKTGSGASGTWGINVTGSAATCSGNAATATKLKTARSLTVQDSTGAYRGASASFDGGTPIDLLMPSKGKFVDGLKLGDGSTSDATKNSIEFYTTSTTSAGAKIVAYSDRIEFVFA